MWGPRRGNCPHKKQPSGAVTIPVARPRYRSDGQVHWRSACSSAPSPTAGEPPQPEPRPCAASRGSAHSSSARIARVTCQRYSVGNEQSQRSVSSGSRSDASQRSLAGNLIARASSGQACTTSRKEAACTACVHEGSLIAFFDFPPNPRHLAQSLGTHTASPNAVSSVDEHRSVDDQSGLASCVLNVAKLTLVLITEWMPQ